ncbi:MAG: PAAR domain-containing protein [Vibrio sp.]
MASGYFLVIGDKTTCHGQILTGDSNVLENGKATAREGDSVSCGKHSGTYKIMGGVSGAIADGRHIAGTLDSISSCPCQAKFIASMTDTMYEG